MATVNWERWARASGIGFVVLYVIGILVAGEQPGVGASVEDVAAYFDGDRGQVLTAIVLFGIGTILFLLFVGSVANALREAGEGALAATTVASGAALAGFFTVHIAIGAGLAYTIAGAGDTGVITALADLTWAIAVITSFPAAAVVLAVSIGIIRTRLVASWYGQIGIPGALIVALGGTTWSSDGFWAADGAATYITGIVFFLWVLLGSVLLYMQAPAVERSPETAAARPM